MSAVYPVGITGVLGEQLSLSTTLASLGIPPGATQALLYAPSSNFRLHINPAVIGVWFYDDSAADGSEYTDYGSQLGDRNTGTAATLSSMTTSDKLYVCCSDLVGGLRVTAGSANANAATMTVKYSKNDNTFADITVTDGTASGGATFAQSGSLTWTVPTDWSEQRLSQLSVAADSDRPNAFGFWLEITVSAELDASTTITELWTLNKNTSRTYLRAGTEVHLSFDRRRSGAIEAILASGTDTLDVNWVRTN